MRRKGWFILAGEKWDIFFVVAIQRRKRRRTTHAKNGESDGNEVRYLWVYFGWIFVMEERLPPNRFEHQENCCWAAISLEFLLRHHLKSTENPTDTLTVNSEKCMASSSEELVLLMSPSSSNLNFHIVRLSDHSCIVEHFEFLNLQVEVIIERENLSRPWSGLHTPLISGQGQNFMRKSG